MRTKFFTAFLCTIALVFSLNSLAIARVDSCQTPPPPQQRNLGTRIEIMPDTVVDGKTFGSRLLGIAAPDDIVAFQPIGFNTIIKRTRDTGRTWEILVNKDYLQGGFRIRNIAHPTPNRIIAVGDSGRTLTSTDAGKSWIDQDLTDKVDLNSISMLDSLHGVVGPVNKVLGLRTDDGGLTWKSLNIPSSIIPAVTKVMSVHYPAHDVIALILVAGDDTARTFPKILITTNGGADWSLRSRPGGSDFHINNLVVFRGKDTITTSVYESYIPNFLYSYNNIFDSFDGGFTWCQRLHDTAMRKSYAITGLGFDKQNRLVVAGDGVNIYWSPDNGKTWVNDSSLAPLPYIALWQLVPLSDTLFVGTRGTSFIRVHLPKAITGVSEGSTESADGDGTSVSVNPNPADSRTVVFFSLQKEENITIEVRDILGNLVRETETKRYQAGENRVEIETNGLPQGVYFVRVWAGGKMLTKAFQVRK